MEIIKLPPILPSDLNLTAVNQKLRDGTAQLDWNAVISAPPSALKILLDGIAEDSELLGLDDAGISDQIIDVVSQFFLNRTQPRQQNPSKLQSAPKQLTFLETQYVAASKPEATGSLIESQFVVKAPETHEKTGPETAETSSQPNAETAANKVLNKPTAAEIRAELEAAIFNDLLGPAGGVEEEIDEDNVSDRYLVGAIAPLFRRKTAEEQPEQQDELAIADRGNSEEGIAETNVPPSTTMFPSSMGMTFSVSGDAKTLEITAKWGKYEKEKSQIYLKDNGEPKQVWKRHPIEGVCLQPLQNGKEFNWIVNATEAPDVYIKGQMQRMDNQDWIVTLFLVNAQREPAKLRDKAWIFQSQIIVRSGDKNTPEIFLKKPLPPSLQNLDPMIRGENEAMAMLYRHCVEFAVGHGVSVHAETAPHTPQRAVCLSTCFIPTYEVPKTTPPKIEEIPELSGLALDMKILAEATPAELPNLLNPLPNAYETWIERQEELISDPAAGLADYQNPANSAISNCKKALERIREGLATLQNDPHAAEAFQFMNQAMHQQRIRSLYAEKIRRGEAVNLSEIDGAKNRSWYPFQLAFILLNLPSITNLHHRDRSHPTEAIADLLWFPTGGGKTEAYLGLTAYTLGLRRLQGIVGDRDGERGVAVLMRYTLRLLTLQQFQRATTLICACEFIRRQNEPKWGKEPFRIGLWVGQNSTPNYTSQSHEFTKQKRGQSYASGTGSPHQLTNCPWCGSKIDPGKHITVDPVDKGKGRTYVHCGDSLGKCLFSKGEGLPILVVDEEIYRHLPALLIATVDKFAQMPWKGEIQMLFGQVTGYCERHGFRSPDLDDKDSHKKTDKLPAAKTVPHLKLRPPDLIIQDELHLISGPLGTLVGLYETAVDELTSWEVNGQKVRPKVIASTATIRQAIAQVHNIFLRDLQVFPPQTLDIQDNFFSRQRTPSEEYPGRRYLGICAPGKRLKAALIRVYVAVLAASQFLYEKYSQDADPWMTLVGYFNSLRELGGTRRLVEDDIRTRLTQMDRRGLSKRYIRNMDELTSRKDSTEIPAILDKLEIQFDPVREAENKKRRQANQKVENPDPLDVILATNMISVGVDVKRLGVMVACGQPKNTAEYIQATSRVGRTYPGLVITAYNWARPRDLSHYERFEHYHATFYQNVEALSVTPFAPGALYRGLSALLVSLVRLNGEAFNHNEKAGKIERNHSAIQTAIEAIVQRASLIEDADTGDRVREELDAKLDKWLNKIQTLIGGGILKYQIDKRDGITVELLQNAGRGEWQDFTCLNSLRNVEPTVGLIFTSEPPDDDLERLPQPFINAPS